MDKILRFKNNISPLIRSSYQRRNFELATIELTSDYKIIDYLYDHGYLDPRIDGKDNSNQCIDILNYLLNNNDQTTYYQFLNRLIIKNYNYLFNLILKYFIIDQTLILKLLHFYHQKKSLTIQQIKNIIEKRENKNWKENKGNQFHLYENAIIHKNYPVLALLLDYYSDEKIIGKLESLNLYRQVGKSNRKINYEKFQWIIENDRLDLLKILIANGLNVTFCDQWNNPPLLYAIRAEKYSIIDYLIHFYHKIPKLPLQDLSKLIQNGRLDILKLLLPHNKVNLKLLNFKGKYDIKEILLKEALKFNQIEIIDYFEECGVDLSDYLEIILFKSKNKNNKNKNNKDKDKDNNNNNESFLKEIILQENITILKVLKENYIDFNEKDEQGYSALDYAIQYHKIKVIHYIVNHQKIEDLDQEIQELLNKSINEKKLN